MLLRKTAAKRNHTKLSAWDVQQIREWVRSEGFGLDLREQLSALEALYPVGRNTLRDVVTGESWADASYDRTVKMDGTPDAAPLSPIFMMFFLIQFYLRGLNVAIPGMPGVTPVSTYEMAQ